MHPSRVDSQIRIGGVAAAAGVNIQTLRYYERRGLLAPPKRTTAGKRTYGPEAIRVVRFIKRAQDLGFTLDEVGELLELRRRRRRSRQSVQRLAATKAHGIDEKLRRLEAMRRALSTLIETCRCAGEPECPILEALDDKAPTVVEEVRGSR